MNSRRTITVFLISLLTALGLCSCGSSHATHLLYVTTGQGIYGYRIDNKSGSSSSLFTTPFLIGNAPAGVAISLSSQLLYVANENDNNISLLKIDPVSGVLTEVLPRTDAGGFSPNQILLDSAGSTLFVANQQSNSVTSFSVGSAGALSLVSTASVGSQPLNLAFAGGLLFVAVQNFSRVYVFSVSSGTLTPVNGSPFAVNNGAASVTVDPAAKYLYVTNLAANTISVFTIQYASGSNTVTLTSVPGSPFVPTATTIPIAPVAAILDPAATHLYVANNGSGSVSQFSIGTNGALTSLATPTVAVGTNPGFLVIDPDGVRVYVANIGSKSITELPINSDATLGTTIQSINIPSVPQGIAVTK